MWLVGILTLSLISGIVCQCCPPDQWEATEDVFAGQKKGNDMFVTRVGFVDVFGMKLDMCCTDIKSIFLLWNFKAKHTAWYV